MDYVTCCQGEITLVIEGAPEAADRVHQEADLREALETAMADGHTASSAVRVVRAATGAAKRDLYQLAVQLAGEAGDSETRE